VLVFQRDEQRSLELVAAAQDAADSAADTASAGV
jgi:hypothetical protein